MAWGVIMITLLHFGLTSPLRPNTAPFQMQHCSLCATTYCNILSFTKWPIWQQSGHSCPPNPLLITRLRPIHSERRREHWPSWVWMQQGHVSGWKQRDERKGQPVLKNKSDPHCIHIFLWLKDDEIIPFTDS